MALVQGILAGGDLAGFLLEDLRTRARSLATDLN